MPRPCLEIMGEFGWLSHVWIAKPGLTSMYQTAGGKGLSKVTAQTGQKLFLQEIEDALLHHFHHQLIDATLGRREKEKEGHRSAILATLLVQFIGACKSTIKAIAIPRYSSKNKRKIHQYQFHWAPCRLPCCMSLRLCNVLWVKFFLKVFCVLQCVGIAAAGMNHFKGSFGIFASDCSFFQFISSFI